MPPCFRHLRQSRLIRALTEAVVSAHLICESDEAEEGWDMAGA